MRFLTINETAERCRVSKYTVRAWIKDGRLPATKPGKSYLIPEQSVIDHLTQAQVSSTPMDEYIQTIVDSAPELTPEQISRLRQILAR